LNHDRPVAYLDGPGRSPHLGLSSSEFSSHSWHLPTSSRPLLSLR